MSSTWIRTVALGLTVLTGFSGLVYQVAWQKYLASLLGSHAEATATVLGIFLGGLSVGYAVFGRVARSRIDRGTALGKPAEAGLLWVYGAVEASIGLYALVFPLLFSLLQGVSLALATESELGTFAIDVVLTILLIGPPAVLMGGTIPLLTQGLARDLEDATRFHAFVYAFNTLGAFAGALAGGIVLVPMLGLEGSVVSMGLVNLAAGGLFLVLGRSAPIAPAAEVQDDQPRLLVGASRAVVVNVIGIWRLFVSKDSAVYP
jgi:spermidine synthase